MHQRDSRLFYWLRLCGDRNLADAAGDDQATIEMDFEIESDVDASKLQEAATERAPGEPGGSKFREKTAAPNQNFTGAGGDDCDLIRAVFGSDDKPVHVLPSFEL